MSHSFGKLAKIRARGYQWNRPVERAFQREETRVLSNDWVIRYDTRYFQVVRQSHQAPVQSTVLVREAVTGAIEIRYGGVRR